MIDFGFTLSKSSTVDLNKIDRSRYDQLVKLVPTARMCMNCGSCGATCTVSEYKGMSVRKVLNGIQRGEDVKARLSSCMLCGKCTMVCPRGINTRNLILNLCKLYD